MSEQGSGATLHAFAPAKVNLTLRVLGRRADGYHLIDSLVAFADVGDHLTFESGERLDLVVHGPTEPEAGPLEDNLVLKAARALANEIPALKMGRFTLDKQLPVAAGLGGGSSDAAAALRLLAQANGIPADGAPLMRAAAATGADVSVCLDPRARRMRGIGEIVSAPIDLEALPAVLVNPRVSAPTREVFAELGLQPGAQVNTQRVTDDSSRLSPQQLWTELEASGNDLEAPAVRLHPRIKHVLDGLRELEGCRLARMSGSGATCFALFATRDAADAGARALRSANPSWWIAPTSLR